MPEVQRRTPAGVVAHILEDLARSTHEVPKACVGRSDQSEDHAKDHQAEHDEPYRGVDRRGLVLISAQEGDQDGGREAEVKEADREVPYLDSLHGKEPSAGSMNEP
jgi:hypothetical protein